MVQRSLRFLMLLFVVGCFVTAPQLRADSMPAISFTSSSENFTNGSWSLGFQFTTNVATDVTALGFYNALLNGGTSGISAGCACGEVGIYDSTGTLLTSATVTGSDTAVNFFNYASIAPIVLASGGTYYAVAETGSAQYTFDTTGFTTSADINFVQDAYVSSTTLAFPTTSDGVTAADGGAYFGANFEETAATSTVPEPATLPLLAVGMVGTALGFFKRRKGLQSA